MSLDFIGQSLKAWMGGSLAVATFMVFSGCLDNGVSRRPLLPDEVSPVVRLRVGVSPVTALGKSSVISLDRVEVVLSSSANDTVRDTITSTTIPALNTVSTNPQTLSKSYSLKALRSWKMMVTTRDVLDSLVHRDSAFIPELYAGDSAHVSINLAARYSMYEARFLSLPDSITSSTPSQPKQALHINRLMLLIDGVAVRDSFATPGPYFASGVPHVLAFDYVAVGTGSWVAVASGTPKNLHAVQFPSPDTGYIVGDTVVMKSVDGGSSWNALTGAAPRSLRHLSFINGTTGVTGGDSATIGRTSDGGATWSLQKISNFISMAAPVFMLNDTGFSLTNAITPTGASTYRRTTNGGVNWTFTSGFANNIYGMSCVSTSACWAVGYAGTIRKSIDTDGSFSSPQTSGTTRALHGVHFRDANVGWAVGDTGTILKTTNGGSTWGTQTSGTTQNLRAVHFLDTAIGYAAGHGGVIVATTNGGTTWAPQTSGTTQNLNGIWFSGATGFAVGNGGTILKLNDVRHVEMRVYGPMGNWNVANPLYAGSRYLNVTSGEDVTTPLVLRWVGPTTGTGSLNAEISRVGKVIVDGDIPDVVVP